MTNLPRNLPEILRRHGLKVVEIDGWEKRGHDGPFDPVGVLCHHTAGHDGIGDPGDDLAYVKNVLVKGRRDLAGPLCQLALSAEGVVYIVAAGRAYHAGNAKKSGTVAAGNGNSLYIGIEAMNAGNGKDVWEKSQYDAYVKLAAVLCVEITDNSHNTVRAHRETSVTGKIDPRGPIPHLNEKSFDMGKFRTRVKNEIAKIKSGKTPAGAWKWNPDVVSTLSLVQEQFQIAAGVRKGKVERYHGIAAIQNALNVKFLPKNRHLDVDGIVGKDTLAAMRDYERKHGGTGRATTPDPESLGPGGLQIMYRFEGPETGASPAPAPKPEPKPTPKPEPKPKPSGTSASGELRVAFHNINVTRSPADVEKHLAPFLKDEKPDIMFLAEAKNMYAKLDFVGPLGYTARQQKSKTRYPGHAPESANIAVLVRNGVDIKVNMLIQQDVGFRGPKAGITHDPRVHRYMVVNKDSINWPVAGIHGPFGDRPVDEMCDMLVKWLEVEFAAHERAIIVGDFNMGHAAVERRIGDPTLAAVDGAGIDLAVYRGCTKVRGENFDEAGSDHDLKMWTFRK